MKTRANHMVILALFGEEINNACSLEDLILVPEWSPPVCVAGRKAQRRGRPVTAQSPAFGLKSQWKSQGKIPNLPATVEILCDPLTAMWNPLGQLLLKKLVTIAAFLCPLSKTTAKQQAQSLLIPLAVTTARA